MLSSEDFRTVLSVLLKAVSTVFLVGGYILLKMPFMDL